MTLNFENLVVGSNLEAVIFAFLNGYHLVLLEGREPLPFETLGPDEAFDEIKFPNHTEEWLTESGECIRVGNEASKLFDHLVYIHALSGLLISQNGATQFFEIFSSEKKCQVYTDNGVLIYQYENLHLFQLENVLGISINDQKNQTLILDWFNVDSGRRHEYRLATPSFGTLYFHTTDRGRNPQCKDVLLRKIVDAGDENLEQNMMYIHKLNIEEYMSEEMGIQGLVRSDRYIQPITVEPKERQEIARITGNPVLTENENYNEYRYYDIYNQYIDNLSGYSKKVIDRL